MHCTSSANALTGKGVIYLLKAYSSVNRTGSPQGFRERGKKSALTQSVQPIGIALKIG